FILSQHAFAKLGRSASAGAALLALGVVDVQYRRSSVISVWMQTESLTCKLVDRSHGAVWAVALPPRGPLSARMLLSGDDGDVTWLVPPNDVPEDWRAGAMYDSGIQAYS
ncbi:hypothetical protein GW17_00047561, partial [Ensete ventricosum]